MRAFAYTAFTAEGARRRGTLVAESEAQAADLLRGQGLFAEEITAKRGAARRRTGLGRRTRLNADMRAVFTRQMAVLLSSDLTAETALDMPFYHPVIEEGLRTALRALCVTLGHMPEPPPRDIDCGPGA